MPSFGQLLNGNDLIKIYKNNKDTLSQICASNNYVYSGNSYISPIASYSYLYKNDNLLKITCSYKEDSLNANAYELNYWLKDKKELKHITKQFLTIGFKYYGSKDLHTPGNTFVERYRNREIQIDIISSSANPPYWIMIHPKQEMFGF